MYLSVWGGEQERSRGATDNASDYGSEDCRFESCRDQQTFFATFFATLFSARIYLVQNPFLYLVLVLQSKKAKNQ
jgi:hypothetical protein